MLLQYIDAVMETLAARMNGEMISQTRPQPSCLQARHAPDAGDGEQADGGNRPADDQVVGGGVAGPRCPRCHEPGRDRDP